MHARRCSRGSNGQGRTPRRRGARRRRPRVVPISRSHGVDVITGEGLEHALQDVDSVIDAATVPSPEQAAATEFFTTASRNLHVAGRNAGVRRMVVVSIIGADRFRGGYGAAKVAHERTALDGPVPATILRAAQFHEFVPQLMEWGRQGAAVKLPEMRTQLVSAHVVAEALAELATQPDAPDGQRCPRSPAHARRASWRWRGCTRRARAIRFASRSSASRTIRTPRSTAAAVSCQARGRRSRPDLRGVARVRRVGRPQAAITRLSMSLG